MSRTRYRLSLQTRLFLMILAIVALAAIAGNIFINRSVGEAFSTFTVRSFTRQDQLVATILIGYHARTGGFEGLVPQMEESDPVPLLLLDPEGEIVYPTDWESLGHTLTEREIARGETLTLPNGDQWTLIPYQFSPERAAAERVFFHRIRRSLWLAGLAATLAGLLISLLLRRQVTRPLRQLDAAAQRIAAGNLSERVPIETSDEFGHVAASFNDMAESLEASEQAKRRMIADIAHELRTPITVIRSALEGLRDGLIDPTQETFSSLHNRILLLTRLVADLHQLALADAGRLSINSIPLRLDRVIEGIVETVGVQAEDAGLELETSLEGGLPSVAADGQRVEQILLNLLANAIRHTPSGGRILITAAESESFVEVSVCDTGSGIDPADLPHIFDRFYRADLSRAQQEETAESVEVGNSGLGLPIAKALVEAHGGTIRAEGVPTGGTCIRFTLPMAPSNP